MLLASDSTDGGREALGVPNIEDSRRNGAFEAAAGVVVPAVLIATLRFS